MRCDSILDLPVHCDSDKIGDLTHNGKQFADIIEVAPIVEILFFLLDLGDLVCDVEAGRVRRLDHVVEEFECGGGVGRGFGEQLLEEGGSEMGREEVVDDGAGSVGGDV